MSETEPGVRSARVARAATGSALGVLVALAAHLAGGGSAPPLAILLAAAVLVQPAAVLLAGRSPRLWRQAAVVGLGQAAMHVTFALGSAGGTAMHADVGMSGMHHTIALPFAAPTPPMHDMGAMWAWHAAAWALTTAAWRWGGSALRSVLAAARRLPRSRPDAPAALSRLAILPTAAPARSSSAEPARAYPRRGPPADR